MKSFFNSLSNRFPFFANRPSALERAVRQSPKSRRLRMEPLENRALLAVDAFGGAALADVGESWGPDPAPAFSASELSTDAAETTISLAALNSVPYGPYVTSEQAALIALRSNATLADETLADFGSLWDETDETTLAETETDGETLNVVAEALTFEPIDLGEIEQEPGDVSLMSGSTGNSGQNGQGDGSGDAAVISFGVSGGIDGSLVMPGPNLGVDAAILEGQTITFTLTPKSGNPNDVVVTATLSGMDAGVDYVGNATREITLTANGSSFTLQMLPDFTTPGVWDSGDETLTITLSVTNGTATIEKASFTLLVVEKPEFISDVDRAGTLPVTYNNDVYRSYFKKDAMANSEISLRTNIYAGASPYIEYYFWDNINQCFTTESQYFTVSKAENGEAVVSLRYNAMAIQASHNYEAVIQNNGLEPRIFNDILTIYACDTRFILESGGMAYTDVASLEIDLSMWWIYRNGSALASAVPRDGCTIGELAEEIGLSANEFREWLTIRGENELDLFNGDTVSVSALKLEDKLANTNTSPVRFWIPNTMYAVWIWDPNQKATMGWNDNLSGLAHLGFNVISLSNVAKDVFFNTMENLSTERKLHGIYFVGHGAGQELENGSGDGQEPENEIITSFGFSETAWGPSWNMRYYSAAPKPRLLSDSGQYVTDFTSPNLGMNHALNYNLAAMALHSCYAMNPNADSKKLLAGDNPNAIRYIDENVFKRPENTTIYKPTNNNKPVEDNDQYIAYAVYCNILPAWHGASWKTWGLNLQHLGCLQETATYYY